jgi:hypothetical protein
MNNLSFEHQISSSYSGDLWRLIINFQHGSSTNRIYYLPEIASSHQASRRCWSFPRPAGLTAITSTRLPAATRASRRLATPGYHKEDRRPGRELRPASEERPFSGPTIAPPSLAKASPLRKEFRPYSFNRHDRLPRSSIFFLLTAINNFYSLTCLSLRTTGFDIPQ